MVWCTAGAFGGVCVSVHGWLLVLRQGARERVNHCSCTLQVVRPGGKASPSRGTLLWSLMAPMPHLSPNCPLGTQMRKLNSSNWYPLRRLQVVSPVPPGESIPSRQWSTGRCCIVWSDRLSNNPRSSRSTLRAA